LFGESFRGFVWSISRPAWTTSSFITTPFSSIAGYFSKQSSVIERNIALEEELEKLRVRLLDYELLLEENRSLKEEFGRGDVSDKILSAVLSKPPRSPYDTLVLDIGSEDGVVRGSRVYIGENIIIGLITNITPQTSLVNLFSTNGEKQEVTLARTGESFLLEGRGGGNFKLEVPIDTDVVWGDTFVYPGISQSVIANVYYVDTSTQSSFKTIYLKTPTNVFSSKYVFVQKAD
jgi:cell shape-determining protein MreC